MSSEWKKRAYKAEANVVNSSTVLARNSEEDISNNKMTVFMVLIEMDFKKFVRISFAVSSSLS